MKQFQIDFFNGHPIITEGENWILIDTGAPSTIHRTDQIRFCGDSYGCVVNYMGLTISNFSELIGTEITTLLGADVLLEYKILFDYANEVVTFSKDDMAFTGKQVEISNFMGIPILQMSAHSQVLKFFLDTGARLSYVTNDITKDYASIGTEVDFYPGVGQFETDCFEVPVVFDANSLAIKFGNLPEMLQRTLRLNGIRGIIGYDFFSRYQVLLDIQNGRLIYV